MGDEFHKTMVGAEFFEIHILRIVRALEKSGEAFDRMGEAFVEMNRNLNRLIKILERKDLENGETGFSQIEISTD